MRYVCFCFAIVKQCILLEFSGVSYMCDSDFSMFIKAYRCIVFNYVYSISSLLPAFAITSRYNTASLDFCCRSSGARGRAQAVFLALSRVALVLSPIPRCLLAVGHDSDAKGGISCPFPLRFTRFKLL